MEFAKYHNVTNKLNELISKEKVSSYTKDYCKGLYICNDTHDFWICRIVEGYNEEFEQEEGKWLVERNRLNKYDFIDFLEDKYGDKLHVKNRRDRDSVIDHLTTDFTIENIILMDDDKGLEGWDNHECDSYNEAVDLIDGGFGIIEAV
jgi:hypothetical protein